MFNRMRRDTALDIAALSTAGEPTIEALLEEPFLEGEPRLSPDGRWMAYISNETGQDEVHVRPFPNVNDGRWQISTRGGVAPLWGPDSRNLFYRTPPGPDGSVTVMMTVNDTDTGFSRGTPSPLFEGVFRDFGRNSLAWDIAPDGERFLMIKDKAGSTQSGTGQIDVVLNWTEELKRLVPTP